MAVEVERLVVRLEATQAKFEKQLARANQTADRRSRAIERRFNTMNKRLSAGFARTGAQLAAVFVSAATLRGAQRLIDASTRIDNALKVAGLSGEELTKVYDRLFESAQRNAAPLESLVELYSRAALVQNELGVSTEELLGFTDKVAVALRVSGKSAAESSGALLQLSQALGSGIVRAEEFNSILDGASPIAQAAAAGLEEAGGSVAKLRTLVIEGKVSSEAFFRAFEAGAVILESKVADAEFTVSQGFARLANTLIDVSGEFDKATGVSRSFVGILDNLSENIEAFGDFAIRVADGPLGQFVARLKQANELAGHLNRLILNSEPFRAVYDFIAPPPDPTRNVDPSRFGGELPVKTGPGKTGRLQIPQRTVSLADFAVPSTGSGQKSSAASETEFQREVAQIKERTEAIIAETQAMAGLNPLINDYGASVEKARAAVELEAAARKAGLEITPELKAQIDALATAYAGASAEAEKLAESQDKAREAAEEMRELGRDVLGGFIADLRNGKSAADALSSALDKVISKMLNSTLDSLLSGGFGSGGSGGGGLLGGLIIPGVLHSGGMAGRDGYGHGRAVPASAFANAPRYHKGGIAGMRPNEVPAILERGELVVPKNARASGGSPVNLSVQNMFDGESIRTIVRDESGRVVARSAPSIVNAAKSETYKGLAQGDADPVMKGRFGVRPQGVRRAG